MEVSFFLRVDAATLYLLVRLASVFLGGLILLK